MPKLSKLSDLQRRVLSFLYWTITVHGFVPSNREIATHFGWKLTDSGSGSNNVGEHLDRLERGGFIERPYGAERHKCRALSVTALGRRHAMFVNAEGMAGALLDVAQSAKVRDP